MHSFEVHSNESACRKRSVLGWNESNRACDNGKNNSDQKIYASMSGNDECSSENYGYSLQLTNWILVLRPTRPS